MAETDRLAVAAHLHVLLRRKTGRVTDTEWLAENPEYASAMVQFALHRAVEDAAPELETWALKLEAAWLAPDPQPARSVTLIQRLKPQQAVSEPPRYVRSLR